MSPSSITSLPPSLPSLSKRHSVEGFQIMMWQWNPSVDHFLKSIIKIVIWGNCILYIISVVCSLAENHSLFIGIAWGSNLRAFSEYPSSLPGAVVGQRPRWEDTVTTCNRLVKLGIDPQVPWQQFLINSVNPHLMLWLQVCNWWTVGCQWRR